MARSGLIAGCIAALVDLMVQWSVLNTGAMASSRFSVINLLQLWQLPREQQRSMQ
jgi:hypothetical protein